MYNTLAFCFCNSEAMRSASLESTDMFGSFGFIISLLPHLYFEEVGSIYEVGDNTKSKYRFVRMKL